VLADEGIASAIAALDESSAVPVRVAGTVGARLEPLVEEAAYVVVAQCVRGARGPVDVALSTGDGLLVLTIRGRVDPPARALEDRIAAASGTILAGEDETGFRIRIELPCGS
jgi:hypothetical protein